MDDYEAVREGLHRDEAKATAAYEALERMKREVERLRAVLDIRNKDSFVTERHHAALDEIARLRARAEMFDKAATDLDHENERLRAFLKEHDLLGVYIAAALTQEED